MGESDDAQPVGEADGILRGITVVSVEQAVALPFATRQLADLGARVIKVERPGAGDFARGYDTSVLGQSSYFVWLNRGKESISLDLKDGADREVLDLLISNADIFAQNLAPGAADRLGLGGDELRRRDPRLITCAVSGYGLGGPYGAKKAYDLLVQCEAGFLSVTGTEDDPVKAGISVADISAGMYAYTGILTALYKRERTGEGSRVDVAMLDALSEWMTQPHYYTAYGARPVRRTGARHASIAPYGPYRCGDGETVFIGVQNDREWKELCEHVLRDPQLTLDARFAHNTDRVEHNETLTTIVEEALGRVSTDQAIALLEHAGIANARVRSVADLHEHPQLGARERWQPIDTPNGAVRALLPPAMIAGHEAVMGSVPAVGQHTDAILAEVERTR